MGSAAFFSFLLLRKPSENNPFWKVESLDSTVLLINTSLVNTSLSDFPVGVGSDFPVTVESDSLSDFR